MATESVFTERSHGARNVKVMGSISKECLNVMFLSHIFQQKDIAVRKVFDKLRISNEQCNVLQ